MEISGSPALHFIVQSKSTRSAVCANLFLRGTAWERPGASGRHGASLVGHGRQPPQPAMRAGQPTLDGLAQVGQQMPSVGHLDRGGRADCDGAGILRRAVACDHLDPWPLPQPAGQRGRSAVRQEINHPTPLQIDDDRAVAASTAFRPVIDADHARSSLVRQRQSVEQAQHGVGAGRHGQPGQQPRAGFAAQRGAGPALRLGQPARTTGKGHNQLR